MVGQGDWLTAGTEDEGDPSERVPLATHHQPGNRQPHVDDSLESPWSRESSVMDALELDFSDDEILLDWQQYSGLRRVRIFGQDCTAFCASLPFLKNMPPTWWYRYSMRQRKAIATGLCLCSGLLVLSLVTLAVVATRFNKGAAAGVNDGAPAAAPPTPTPNFTDDVGGDFCEWKGFRLPKDFKPSSYALELDLSDLRSSGAQEPVLVKGSVVITVAASAAFRCIPLHADLNRMSIAPAILRRTSTGAELQGSVTPSPGFSTSGIALVEFGEPVGPGDFQLTIRFSYSLGSSLSGLYMSNFTDTDGIVSRMAVTQFEATSARQAFPCFDEPAAKAEFAVRVTVQAGMTVLGNMPETGRVAASSGSTVTYVFQTTPAMSTYLVAIVAGNLTRVTAQVEGRGGGPPRPVSVYGTQARAPYLQKALQFAVACLRKYESLLQVDYSLPKMDLVAIPDFSAGAMENWGLITYRETDLLVREDEDSAPSIHKVAMVVAHEIAHQWFGNLVTMEFWGDLWLNEGFASYLEYIGASAALEAHYLLPTQETFPGIDVWKHFFPDVAARAAEHDALADTTMPLSTEASQVTTTEQVESFFNPVPYDKGASVLRMLRAWMNRNNPSYSETEAEVGDRFIEALRSYLKAHAYRTATTSDFLISIGEASDEPAVVRGMMGKWVGQKYIPILRVNTSGSNEVDVSQAPLPPIEGSCEDMAGDARQKPWQVPLSYVSGLSTSLTPTWTLLSHCQTSSSLYVLQGPEDYVKLNSGQVGLYTVNYAPQLWDRLVEAAILKTGEGEAKPLSPSDLAGLISDSYHHATHGETNITIYLRLLSSLSSRPLELEPWLVAYDTLTDLHGKLESANAEGCVLDLESFARYDVLAGFVPIGSSSNPPADVSRLRTESPGFSLAYISPNEGYEQRLLRPMLLSLAAMFGDELVQGDAVRELARARETNAAPPGDVRYLIYKLAAKTSRVSWAEVADIYSTAASATEKRQALLALGNAQDPTLVRQTLELAVSGRVRSQDTVTLIQQVASAGGEALDAAMNFTMERWQQIGSLFESKEEKSHQLGSLLSLAGGFSTQEAIDELTNFWEETAAEDVGEGYYLNSATDRIRANIEWKRLNLQDACEWLDERGKREGGRI